MTVKPLPIAILISGNGSNLQAIIDAQQNGLAVDIRVVIANNPNAYGIIRAQKAGIPTEIISHKQFANRGDFDLKMADCLQHYQPELVVLAGFMRHLGPAVVTPWLGKLINIHPSLLPKFPGLHTHQRVLEAGDLEHGTSIHFVTNDLDAGPIICQARLSINPQETAEALQARVQILEHYLYPKTLAWFAHQQIELKNSRVWLDQHMLAENGLQFTEENLVE